ncbi:MAG: hypothetical protein RI922_1637 [Bacteroidota bacterium]|jgi:hypothetical protein
MSDFYKMLILGLCSLGLGIWFLYDTVKHPAKNEYGYDSKVMDKIRGIGLIVMGIIALWSCLSMKI